MDAGRATVRLARRERAAGVRVCHYDESHTAGAGGARGVGAGPRKIAARPAQVFAPREFVYHAGERATTMYIVHSGMGSSGWRLLSATAYFGTVRVARTGGGHWWPVVHTTSAAGICSPGWQTVLGCSRAVVSDCPRDSAGACARADSARVMGSVCVCVSVGSVSVPLLATDCVYVCHFRTNRTGSAV